MAQPAKCVEFSPYPARFQRPNTHQRHITLSTQIHHLVLNSPPRHHKPGDIAKIPSATIPRAIGFTKSATEQKKQDLHPRQKHQP
jgi:hypothetical protein